MKPQILLHQDGKWLAFEGDAVKLLDARPRVDRSSVVITDFDGGVSDVASLEGSPAHASALIERRLRADGLLDGDSKVLIHHLRTVGNGYQALFTAVPLDRWQPLFAWADDQDDHCLLVPTMALLWRQLKPGRGVVLHSGRKVVFLAALRSGVVQASALAFSDAREDLMMTVAALGERAGRLLSADEGALEPLDVRWIGTLTALPTAAATRARTAPERRADPVLDRWPTPEETPTERNPTIGPTMSFDGQDEYRQAVPKADGDALPASAIAPGVASVAAPLVEDPAQVALDDAMAEAFATNSGASVTLAAHVTVNDASGRRYRSAVPPLLAQATAAIAVNSPVSRAMHMAERVLPWASAASLLLAVGLGALGGRWTLAAHQESTRADALRAEIAVLDERIGSLAARQALPTDYQALLGFIARATALGAALDPTATLLELRAAAGADVRLLRLRLESAPGQPITLRVDGTVNYAAANAADQGQQVARFVQRLRDAGYVPTAIDPQVGNTAGSAPGGLFSYRLTRAADADAPGAPSMPALPSAPVAITATGISP
ncbi:MAG TPA: hypothetical protein DCM32_02985 [Xanthomonadaceae bacterium]|nr:hypothetical protein [Xanthomonadaceae bacterium]